MSILDIRIQKLFLIVLALKLLSSGLGWYLQSPWLFGLAIPLAFMCVYIGLGVNRRDTDVSDEKFADSCYYLGFIFTITSIIFSLFDLPNIGTQIQNIAVRFGAAMVSTVLGLGVRVYLVSFRTDVADAIKDAEDALLGATQVFTERLTMSLEKLQDFESRVDLAARSSVERVNLQVESLSKNHADKLSQFFTDLTERNQVGYRTALEEVKNASTRLAHAVDRYSVGMKGNLASIETKVTEFADAVTTRLRNTTFPDDYFAKHLANPLSQLETAATAIATQVRSACVEMGRTTSALSTSLQEAQEKSGDASAAMDSVLKLAGQQHLVLESAQGQLGALQNVADKLASFDALLTRTSSELANTNTTSSKLVTEVSRLSTEAQDVRKLLETTLTGLGRQLGDQATAHTYLVSRMDSNVSATERLVEQMTESASAQISASAHLEASAKAAGQLVHKYGATVEADQVATRALAGLGERADRSLTEMSQAVRSLQDIVRSVGELNGTLRSQRVEPGIAPGRPASLHPEGMSPMLSAIVADTRTPPVSQTTGSSLSSPPPAPSPVTPEKDLPDLAAFWTLPPVAPSYAKVPAASGPGSHATGVQPPADRG